LSLLRIDGDVVEDTNNNPKEVFIWYWQRG
jgi:hypothetical protein